MKFGYTILYVNDVAKTVEFYEKAFSLKRKFLTEENSYAEMDTGSTTLSFASMDMARQNGLDVNQITLLSKAPGFEIAFVTEDVRGAFEQAINNGAEAIKKPQEKPWGQTVGYVRDLNGFLVELATPMEI